MVDQQDEQFPEHESPHSPRGERVEPLGLRPAGRQAGGPEAERLDALEDPAPDPLAGLSADDLVRAMRVKLAGPRRGPRTVRAEAAAERIQLRPEQRLLILDTWVRSKLPAREFADLFGLSKHTLYVWKKRFDELGPAGLDAAPRGRPRGSRISEPTRDRRCRDRSRTPSQDPFRGRPMLTLHTCHGIFAATIPIDFSRHATMRRRSVRSWSR